MLPQSDADPKNATEGPVDDAHFTDLHTPPFYRIMGLLKPEDLGKHYDKEADVEFLSLMFKDANLDGMADALSEKPSNQMDDNLAKFTTMQMLEALMEAAALSPTVPEKDPSSCASETDGVPPEDPEAEDWRALGVTAFRMLLTNLEERALLEEPYEFSEEASSDDNSEQCRKDALKREEEKSLKERKMLKNAMQTMYCGSLHVSGIPDFDLIDVEGDEPAFEFY